MINKASCIGCGSGQECDLGNSSSGKAAVMRVGSQLRVMSERRDLILSGGS